MGSGTKEDWWCEIRLNEASFDELFANIGDHKLEGVTIGLEPRRNAFVSGSDCNAPPSGRVTWLIRGEMARFDVTAFRVALKSPASSAKADASIDLNKLLRATQGSLIERELKWRKEENKKAKILFPESTQYFRLLQALTDAARRFAEADNSIDLRRSHEARSEACEEVFSEAAQIIEDMQGAFVSSYDERASGLDFWNVERGYEAMRDVTGGRIAQVNREEIESVVGRYLDLPYRAIEVDRILVDILIGMEVHAFGDEMWNEPKFWGLPRRSPLRQRHVLWTYVLGQVVNAVVLLGAAGLSIFAGTRGWLGDAWSLGIGAAFVAIFLLVFALGTILLPFSLREQHQSRKKVRESMLLMLGVYENLRTAGPVSASFVRDAALESSRSGVFWPAPLFALLDDNLRRGGRL